MKTVRKVKIRKITPVKQYRSVKSNVYNVQQLLCVQYTSSALGRRLVLRCSENNVRKSEVPKSSDRRILLMNDDDDDDDEWILFLAKSSYAQKIIKINKKFFRTTSMRWLLLLSVSKDKNSRDSLGQC
jgi:hypothetical protein